MRVARGRFPADPDEALVIYEDPVVGLGARGVPWYISPAGGPQDLTMLPSRSNARTGGAGRQHSDPPSTLPASPPVRFWRWTIQITSLSSTQRPIALPKKPMVGKGLRPERIHLEHGGLHLLRLHDHIEPALSEP